MKGKGYSYQVVRRVASNRKSPAKSQVCHLRNARVQQVAYLARTPSLNYFAASHRQITINGKSISNLMLSKVSIFFTCTVLNQSASTSTAGWIRSRLLLMSSQSSLTPGKEHKLHLRLSASFDLL